MIINHEEKSMQMEQRDITYILQAYVAQFEFNTKNSGLKEVVFPMFLRVPHPQTKEPIPIRWVPELSPEAQAIIEDGSDVPEATDEEIAAIDAKDDEIKRLRKELTDANDAITRISQPTQDRIDQLEDEKADAVLEEETAEIATPIKDLDDSARAEEGLSPRPNPFDPEPKEISPEELPFPPKEESAFNVDSNPDHQPPPDRQPVKPAQEATGSPDSMQPRQKGDRARIAKDLRPEKDINEEEEKPFEKKVGRDETGKPTVEE